MLIGATLYERCELNVFLVGEKALNHITQFFGPPFLLVMSSHIFSTCRLILAFADFLNAFWNSLFPHGVLPGKFQVLAGELRYRLIRDITGIGFPTKGCFDV